MSNPSDKDVIPPTWTSCTNYFETMVGRINSYGTGNNKRLSEPFPVLSGTDDCRNNFWPSSAAQVQEAIDVPVNLTEANRLGGGNVLRSFYVPFNFQIMLSVDKSTWVTLTGPTEGFSPPLGSSVVIPGFQNWSTYKWVQFQRLDQWDAYIRNMCMGSTYKVGTWTIGGFYNPVQDREFLPEYKNFNGQIGATAANRFTRGSTACDRFVENYCVNRANWNQDICACIKDQDTLLNHWGVPEVQQQVVCFGPTCSTLGYIIGSGDNDMKKTQCSVPFCYETVRKYSSELQVNGDSHIFCDKRWVPVAPTAIPEEQTGPPQEDPSSAANNLKKSPVWVYYVIGGGVLALAILILLVIIFTKKKKKIG